MIEISFATVVLINLAVLLFSTLYSTFVILVFDWLGQVLFLSPLIVGIIWLDMTGILF